MLCLSCRVPKSVCWKSEIFPVSFLFITWVLNQRLDEKIFHSTSGIFAGETVFSAYLQCGLAALLSIWRVARSMFSTSGFRSLLGLKLLFFAFSCSFFIGLWICTVDTPWLRDRFRVIYRWKVDCWDRHIGWSAYSCLTKFMWTLHNICVGLTE